MSQYKNQIGDDIRRVRKALNLTQAGLAEAFNTIKDGLTTSRIDILKYENGTNVPPADKYIKIMNMLPD